MNDFTGRWKLVATAHSEDDVEWPADEDGFFDEPAYEPALSVLGVSNVELLEGATPSSGISLEVTADDRFSQALLGTTDFLWFDVDGVQENNIVPYDGDTVRFEDRLYLLADERPRNGIPEDERRAKVFRCDDGDTVVCDFIEVIGGRLIRSMNVLTDAVYRSRNLFVYEPV